MLLLSGCNSAASTLQVSNLTSDQKTKLDANFDPNELSNVHDVLASLDLVDRDGHPVHLESTDRPIMFEAYWCPHCQRTLIMFNNNSTLKRSNPIIISSGYPAHTTLKDAVAAADKEFQLLSLSGFTVYYAINPIQVPGYPSLVFQNNGTTVVLTGEHTEGVWEQAVHQD